MPKLKPVIEHVIMTASQQSSTIRGWDRHLFGAYATTVEAPPKEVWKKALGYFPKLLREAVVPYSPGSGVRIVLEDAIRQVTTAWPGYLIITTDGRAIYISSFDFWSRKGVKISREKTPPITLPYGAPTMIFHPKPTPEEKEAVKLWGDFTVRLLTHPKVAEIHDLPPTPPEGAIRAYSEEDVNLLLEHPELRLMEVAPLVQLVQQINALRAQMAELQEEKARLEEEMARLAKEYAAGAYEYRAATEEEKQNLQRLKELTERELALQAQVSQLQAELERARQAQAVQAAQPSKTIWLLVGAGAILLLLLMRR